MIKTNYFECQCLSDEHLLKFIQDDKDIYISMFLHQYRNIFKRIWIAIKYVFGYKCKYGHWDTWMLRPDDTQRLRDLVDSFTEQHSTIKRPVQFDD